MEDEVSMSVNSTVQPTDLSQIVYFIDTLYNSKNAAEQTEANRRLSDLQASQDAWQVCWLLLDSPQSISMEVQFFAAQMLLLKINQSWGQQSEDWLENQMRPKLFEILVKYAALPNADKIVIDRLSLALANFALHSIPTFWPDAIENILQTFTPQNLPLTIPPQRACDILLKILMFIPEEYSVLMPQQDHRAKLNGQMTKSGPLVFKFLHSLLLANDIITSECRQSVLKCLTSWTLHSRTSLLEVEGGKVLLDHIYEIIQDEELCSSACAALAATFDNQKAESYRKSIMEFIPKMAQLSQIIDKYRMSDDMECIIKIYSLVTNFSENHSRLFLKIVLNDGIQLEESQSETLKQSIFTIFGIILESTSAPGIYGMDEKYSDISFPFWFTFFENFYYYSESFNDIICETFNTLVDSLLRTLIQKSQYPPSTIYFQVWNDDQRESYRCYRQDLGDNLSLIVHFPRSRSRILRYLHNELTQELAKMLHGELVNGERPWQSFESVVFAIKSIAEAVPYDEARDVHKIFDILSQVSYNETHPLLYCTVAEMISAYSDWLFSHGSHLPNAYNILFLGVNSIDSHVRLMSTLSLKDITKECQTVLQPYAPQIVKSCTEAILQPDSRLDSNEKSRLMNTIGTSLAVSTSEAVASALNTLTVPLICDLGAKAQVDPNIDPSSRAIILERLKMLNSLIESLYVKQFTGNDFEDGDENELYAFNSSRSQTINQGDTTQPALGLLKQLIPILNVIASKYSFDEDIIEIISDTVKRSAKSLGIDVKPVLEDLLMLVVNVYDPVANSNVLEGTVPLYSLFKVDTSLHDLFMDAFARISDKTLQVCIGNPLRQLSLTIENFFRFALLVCKKYPDFLASQTAPIKVEYIYKLAVACLELPEKRTLAEVCSFLSLFRQRSLGCDHLDRIFISHLDVMLGNIFNIFGGAYSTPRNAIDHVMDLLYAVIDADQCKEPLKMIIEKENFPTNFVNRDQKARFVSRIIHEKNRRKFKDSCSEFVLLVRNLNRST